MNNNRVSSSHESSRTLYAHILRRSLTAVVDADTGETERGRGDDEQESTSMIRSDAELGGKMLKSACRRSIYKT
jgi:hypothetical protein